MRRTSTARGLITGFMGTAITAAFTLYFVSSLPPSLAGETYVRTFDNASGRLNVALASGDGQAFAALALDPTLSRPQVFRGGPREAAYRAQRPLVAYAAWLLSAGRRALVPPALAALFVLGVGLAVGASASLLHSWGRAPELALGLIFLPPVLAAMQWFGPEPLGLGLAVAGVLAWSRDTKLSPWLSAALFSLAGLTRETILLVPLAIATVALLRREHSRRALLPLTVPVLVWVTWATVVHLRLDYWPWAGGGCRVSDLPFAGLIAGAQYWPPVPIGNVALIVLGAALVGACLWRRRSAYLSVVVVAFALLAIFMGDCVWRRWEDFTRPLLPLYAFGLLSLLAPQRGGRDGATGSRRLVGRDLEANAVHER